MSARRSWRMVLVELAGLVLLTGVLAAAPAQAIPVAGTLHASPAGAVVPGEPVTLSGRLTPAIARPVRLQSRLGSAPWITLTTGRSTPTGRFSLVATVSGDPGQTVRYRVLAPATRLAGRPYAARTSPTVSALVVIPNGAIAAPRLAVEHGTIAVATEFAPARQGRRVTVQAWDGDSWTAVGHGVENARGRSSVTVTTGSPGPLTLRARADAWRGIPAAATQTTSVGVRSAIGLGNNHSCQVRPRGTLWCWGSNIMSQLGDNSDQDSAVPTKVVGTGWASVTGGIWHTCGLRDDASAWCWGNNWYGQIGTPLGTIWKEPIQVPGEWSVIAAGGNFTCGIRSDGTLWCWGDNYAGQLGDGTTEERHAPTQVGTADDWSDVRAGTQHACALRDTGTLWCWGRNGYGQVGDGSVDERHAPVQVGTGADWVRISVGSTNTCGVKADGTAWCWGDNYNGLVGNGSDTAAVIPAQVGLASTWLRVETGSYQTCGVRANGSAWCWGLNADGALGTGEVGGVTRTPVRVLGSGWSPTIDSGSSHVCALTVQGQTACWGGNDNGQIGDGTLGANHDRATPTPVLWP